MSWLLRSSKSKLLSSSLSRTFSSHPRPAHAIPPLSPAVDLFHRPSASAPTARENPTSGSLTGLPKDPASTVAGDLNAINLMSYKASGLDTNVLAGARYGAGVWTGQSPMQLGVNGVMGRSFVRGVGADKFRMIGHKRYMSDIPSKTSETVPTGFRPLSPHLPLYQPQLSSTLSIFNRIAGGFLAAVILLFYFIYMKVGLIGLTYDSFYQFVFYSSKLNLLIIEISALATTYHLYSAIRHLLL